MSEAKVKRRKGKQKFKKAPQAPRRFKSAYMFFSTEQHKKIRNEMNSIGKNERTTEIAKLVSLAWKKLNEKDREQWEEIARKDKARFEVEKSLYSGPWRVPTTRSLNHDPSNPKRPMSAFLAFSHAKRAEEKQKNPSFSNAELSRHLAQLWKDASNEEKKFFLEQEYNLRQKYLVDKAAWRLEKDKEFQQERKYREDMAMKKVGNDHFSDSCVHPSAEQTYSDWRTASSRNDGLWTPYEQPIAMSPFASYDSPYQYYHGQPSGTYSGLECSSYSNQFFHRESHSPLYHRPQEFSNHERGRAYHSEFVAYPPESEYAAPQYSETLPIEVYNNVGRHQESKTSFRLHNKNVIYETFQNHNDVESLFEATGHEDTCIQNAREAWDRCMPYQKSDGAGEHLSRETRKCDNADSHCYYK